MWLGEGGFSLRVAYRLNNVFCNVHGLYKALAAVVNCIIFT